MSEDVFMRHCGWKGQNAAFHTVENTISLVSQTTRFSAIGLAAGERVSGLTFLVSSAAATVTTIKVGLYDTSGNRLATSANSATAMNAVGPVTVMFTTPYVSPTEQIVYAALLVDATTPGVVGAWSSVGGKGSPGGGLSFYLGGTEASQTDLDPTATISSNAGVMWWAYV